MSLEHRAVLDGLAPLDGEELARRYAQAQTQALDQALALYGAARARTRIPASRPWPPSCCRAWSSRPRPLGAAQEAVLP